jgi:hypothetical protein
MRQRIKWCFGNVWCTWCRRIRRRIWKFYRVIRVCYYRKLIRRCGWFGKRRRRRRRRWQRRGWYRGIWLYRWVRNDL